MKYIVKEFGSEIVPKIANVSMEDSLKWFKDDFDKLLSILVDYSIKSGYDLRHIDIDDEVDISDDMYNKFGDGLLKVWDSLSMFVGGSILLWLFNDMVLNNKSEDGIDYACERLEDVLKSFGDLDEEYQKRIDKFKIDMKVIRDMMRNKP